MCFIGKMGKMTIKSQTVARKKFLACWHILIIIFPNIIFMMTEDDKRQEKENVELSSSSTNSIIED